MNPFKWAKLDSKEIDQILKGFACKKSAHEVSVESGFNRHTVNRYYQMFRKCLHKDRLAYFRNNINKRFDVDKVYIEGEFITKNKILRKQNRIIIVYALIHWGMVFTTITKDNMAPSISKKTFLTDHSPRLRKWKEYSTENSQPVKGFKFQYLNITRKGLISIDTPKIVDEYLKIFREQLLKYNGVSLNRLQEYLYEIDFRYNYRNKNDLYGYLSKICFPRSSGPDNRSISSSQ